MLTNLTLAFSPELRNAIQIAQAIAKEHCNSHFSSPHLLKAILHNEIGLSSLLVAWGKDIYDLQEWADYFISEYPKSAQMSGTPSGDDVVLKVMEVADVVRIKLSLEDVNPLCVLVALCKPNVGFSEDQLKTFILTENEVLEAALKEVEIADAISPQTTASAPSSNDSPSSSTSSRALLQYCIDKTALASEENLDPIIGREGEVRNMAEILGRRSKPNVLLVGEPGVGKTALVDGFARYIVEGKTSGSLGNARIFEIDLGALIAGASYKGELEDRLKAILKEVKQFEKGILFIDEIHVLLDPQASLSGAANLLKPELGRGEITVIGATTTEEFRGFIEPDEALARRFERLDVHEPDEETACRMVATLLPRYQEHHGIQVEEAAYKMAVHLAKRYLKERSLPDTAIDLVDRTMAAYKLSSENALSELAALEAELKALKEKEEDFDPAAFLAELKWFERQMNHRLSPILLGRLENTDKAEIDDSASLSAALDDRIEKLKVLATDHKETVEAEDIAAMISYKTGIPIGKIQTEEKEKLLHMGATLKKRVIGQDHAIEAIVDAIQISRSGLNKPGLPIGSFFLSGPTGTGKTELAKAIASYLFDDESTLMRFDMSEFKEEHSSATLLGAPSGYVGYKEGGVLVNKIRSKPYSVVLFDEIEKAHPSVFDIFLQLLDEGSLTDRLGKVGDFSNAIILFTSNIGSEEIVKRFEGGSLPNSNDLKSIMESYFRPEFLGRITEVVPFAPITKENIVKIFDIHLRKLVKLLADQKITLTLTEEAKAKIAYDGFNARFGARPLLGELRSQLRKPISKMIIDGRVKPGSTLRIEVGEDNSLDWKF